MQGDGAEALKGKGRGAARSTSLKGKGLQHVALPKALKNMLLQSKSPLCKLGFQGDNNNGEPNKSLKFVMASIHLEENISNMANTSKEEEPMMTPRRKMPPLA